MRALGRKLGQAKRMLESGISTALKSSSVASCSTSGRDYSQDSKIPSWFEQNFGMKMGALDSRSLTQCRHSFPPRTQVVSFHKSAFQHTKKSPNFSSSISPFPAAQSTLAPEEGFQPRAPPVKKVTEAVRTQMNKVCTVYIVSTSNNTICTLVDMRAQVLATATAGTVGFKNSRKSTPYAAQAVGERIAEKAMEKGYFQARIVLKGIGTGKQAATRAIAKSKLNIVSLQEHTSIPHNGCRAPRRRRF